MAYDFSISVRDHFEGREPTYSLEEGLNLDEVNNLGKATYEFADGICGWLNETCSWREYLDFNLVLAPAISQWAYVLFYKGNCCTI